MKRSDPFRWMATAVAISVLSGCDKEAISETWLDITRYYFPWDSMLAVLSAAAVSALIFRLLTTLPIADDKEGDVKKALASLLTAIAIVWSLALAGISMTATAAVTALIAGLALGHMEWQILRSGDPAPSALPKEIPPPSTSPKPATEPENAPAKGAAPAPATPATDHALRSCPHCGQENPAGFGYCTACGNSHTPPLPPDNIWDI